MRSLLITLKAHFIQLIRRVMYTKIWWNLPINRVFLRVSSILIIRQETMCLSRFLRFFLLLCNSGFF